MQIYPPQLQQNETITKNLALFSPKNTTDSMMENLSAFLPYDDTLSPEQQCIDAAKMEEWRCFCQKENLDPDDLEIRNAYIPGVFSQVDSIDMDIEEVSQERKRKDREHANDNTTNGTDDELNGNTKSRKTGSMGEQPIAETQKNDDSTQEDNASAQIPTVITQAAKKLKRKHTHTEIPEEALKRRYSKNCINKTYDVLFQNDHKQEGSGNLNQLKLAKIISMAENEAGIKESSTTTKKLGSSILVSFNTRDEAHNLLTHPLLEKNNIVAYIPEWTTVRKGVIKGINLEFSDEELLKEIHSSPPITEVKRCNRFNKKEDGTTSSTPSQSVLLTFDGQMLPTKVSIYGIYLEVSPYTSQVKRCGNCLRFAHSRKQCRSEKTCDHCSRKDHGDGIVCPTVSAAAKCINCQGEHKSTYDNCPELLRQRAIHKFAAANGIAYMAAKDIFSGQEQVDPLPHTPHPPAPNMRNYPPLPPQRRNLRQERLSSTSEGPVVATPRVHGPQPRSIHNDYLYPNFKKKTSNSLNHLEPSESQDNLPTSQHPNIQLQYHQNPLRQKPPVRTPQERINTLRQHQNLLITPNGGDYVNLNQLLGRSKADRREERTTGPPNIGDHPQDNNQHSHELKEIISLLSTFVLSLVEKLSPLLNSLDLLPQLNTISAKLNSFINCSNSQWARSNSTT